MHFSFYFIKIGQILLEKEFFENRHFARYRDENTDFFFLNFVRFWWNKIWNASFIIAFHKKNKNEKIVSLFFCFCFLLCEICDFRVYRRFYFGHNFFNFWGSNIILSPFCYFWIILLWKIATIVQKNCFGVEFLQKSKKMKKNDPKVRMTYFLT